MTEKEDIDKMTINKIMKVLAEKHLKKKIYKNKEKKKKRKILIFLFFFLYWMTQEVRNEIKKRKELNRKHRNKNGEREKMNLGEIQRTKNKSEITDKERNKETRRKNC